MRSRPGSAPFGSVFSETRLARRIKRIVSAMPQGSAIPQRPFGRHSDVKIAAPALGGHHIGQAQDEASAIAIMNQGDRRRGQFLRQLLGISSREIRNLDGQGRQGPAYRALPHDEGLHREGRSMTANKSAPNWTVQMPSVMNASK